MTFAELLLRARELADAGVSWSDGWRILEPNFRRMSSGWGPLERSRNFEALLAAFVSDSDHVIEPPGSGLFAVPEAAYGVLVRRSE